MGKETEGQYWITEKDGICEGQPYRGYGIAYRIVDETGSCHTGEVADISTERSEVEELLSRIGEEILSPETLQAVTEDYLAEVASVSLA